MAIIVKDVSTEWTQDATTGAFTGYQYRLRAGAPMPVMRGGFVIHTFKAELNQVDTFLCKEDLPGSGEFKGQGGSGATYVSANFSRLNIKGGNTFQGKITYSPSYIDEGSYGFN
jgi:hypothetical protein